MRRHDAHSRISIIFVIFIFDYCNSGSFWQAEPVCPAPAEHASNARDRNGVVPARRDRNHQFISEGIHALRHTLLRYVAVP